MVALGAENGIARIVLTNFIGAEVIEHEDDCGRIQKGVFIPLDLNCLKMTPRGNVSCYAFVNKTICPQQYGWTHYLKLKVRPDFRMKMEDLGYEMPYIGNFKHQNYIVRKDAYMKSYVKVNKE